mmetsp:Transcript_14662/g.20248  ORF Transcript_14662/g.20248 Transcript_14662/m.20248 type:complete len:209 (-) Transcript_14662:74-700(-)
MICMQYRFEPLRFLNFEKCNTSKHFAITPSLSYSSLSLQKISTSCNSYERENLHPPRLKNRPQIYLGWSKKVIKNDLKNRMEAQVFASSSVPEEPSSLGLLLELNLLLEASPPLSLTDQDGSDWKRLLLSTVERAASAARIEATQSGGKELQFRFELVRYIQLASMTMKMITASRSIDTAASRLKQAREQTSRAVQLAELIANETRED